MRDFIRILNRRLLSLKLDRIMIINYLETTINIDMVIYKMLDDATEKIGKSRNHIIKLALKKYDLSNKENFKLFNTVKYQEKRDDGSEWKKFHLILTPAEYEIFTDLRNFHKLSLSFIVAIALGKYLQEIMNCDDTIIHTDTYLFPAYCCIIDVESDVKNYTIYWGVPEELAVKKKREYKQIF